MGGCVSIQVSCDQVLNRVCTCFFGGGNYICNFKNNLVALERAMEDLTVMRDDVRSKVQREEEGGLQRLQRVKLWLRRVETIESRFNELDRTRTAELERLCLCGVCSIKLKSRICYGKRVLLLLKGVHTLISDGVFEVVAVPPTRAVVENMSINPTIVGRETMLERAWNRLTDDGTGIMGFYGMGGVDKTTFLAQINNKFHGANDGVEIVIWIVASSNLCVEKIQDDVAGKLGLRREEWKQKTKSEKASSIHKSLTNRRFVLLLDDIWSKLELTEIGVPFPTRENKCKIVFTTRSREVCGHMGVDDPIEIKCLESSVAWDLFQNKVGQITLESHPDIPELARRVAGKCHGLPLALNVIGETMACKSTVQEWKHAIDVLSSSATEFSGMVDKILPVLKFSYDNLSGKQVQSCFLYCSLFPEDCLIRKEKLIDYWISEGFIEEKEDREKTFNQGYEILGTIIRACLLQEEGRNKSKVKMHDVVREMALWISTNFGKQKERCIVRAGVGLREVPKVKDWNTVRKISLMNNEIEEIFDCFKCAALTTLLLQKNRMVKIPAEFFRCMPHLVVLDLSKNYILNELPEEISELVILRYLDLSETSIKRLPGGLRELKKLIHLNLESTWVLESVLGISSLWNLRTLRLLGSNVLLDMCLVKELDLLKHLEALTIDISSSLVAEQLLCSHRLVECFKELDLDIKYPQEEFVRVLTLPTMINLQRLNIEGAMRDINIEKATSSSWRKSPTALCFPNLSSVVISKCDGLKDLTWLVFASNLINLEVASSDQVEDIISEEKVVTSVTGEGAGIIVPFLRLEKLTLSDLPMLESINRSTLPFPCLRKISVSGCPNLRKLPLDSKSVAKVEELVIQWVPIPLYLPRVCDFYNQENSIQGNSTRLITNPLDSSSGASREETIIKYKDQEWMEGFEWEDEATRLRFLPCCKLVWSF